MHNGEKLLPNHEKPVLAVHKRGALRYLERFLTRHGKPIFYFRKGKGDRVRLPDDYGSAAFMAAYRKAFYGETLPPPKKPKPKLKNTQVHVAKQLRRCLAGARKRAAELRLPYDLDYDWALEMVQKQNHACALTGIQFLSEMDSPHSRLNPTNPSIDRIIPLEGYTKANCRVVCIAVNIMLLDWGEEVFAAMSEAYRAHKARAAITQETRDE